MPKLPLSETELARILRWNESTTRLTKPQLLQVIVRLRSELAAYFFDLVEAVRQPAATPLEEIFRKHDIERLVERASEYG